MASDPAVRYPDTPPLSPFAALHALLADDPGLAARYRDAKKVIRTFRRPAFYETSQRCNLRCEGCYYFEDRRRSDLPQEMTPAEWDRFFAAEGERGVSMAYLVGAEPALHVDRLRAAARHIGHGKIGTNGTIRIPSDIGFRIGLSVWGDAQEDAVLRGGSVLRKALSNYRGDPRAIVLFTLSPWNLHTVPEVVRACADHGLTLTFSMFSPTRTYLDKLASLAPPDRAFFRLGPHRQAPVFGAADLARARDAMLGALDDAPDTVIFSRAYGERITRPGPLYRLDPDSGIASDCGSRIRDPLRYVRADGRTRQVKCCTPDVDCEHCRLYSGGWSSLFRPDDAFLTDAAALGTWLEMIETLGRIFVYPAPG